MPLAKFERILSPSAVNLYFQCPRKFYYRYIKKLPMKDSIYTVRGNIVHDVLEKFYDLDASKLTNLNYKKIMHTELSNLFENEWKNKKSKLAALGLEKDTLNMFYEDSILQIDKWLNKFLTMVDKKLIEVFMIKDAWKYFQPKHRELRLVSNIIGVQGYIDQVVSLNGRTVVIDFKTSKSPKVSPDYALQLAVYHLLYKEKFEVEPETFLWFLKFGLKKVDITEKLIADSLFKIEQVHMALQNKKILDYPKNITPLCKWCNANGSGQCDYYDTCYEQKTLE